MTAPPESEAGSTTEQAASTPPNGSAEPGTSCVAFRRAPGIVVQDFDDELLLLDPATEAVCSLNSTASAVWELADGRRDAPAIAAVLAAHTGEPLERVAADVRAFVAELTNLGFLHPPGGPTAPTLPERVRAVMDAAIAAQVAYEREVPKRQALYLPSDPASVYGALAAVRRYTERLVELGSGLGALAMVAELLGFTVSAVEADPELCRRARALAESVGSALIVHEGSFIPEDFVVPPGLAEARLSYALDAPPPRPALCLAEFDCWLATPWPGTEALIESLFRERARPRAVLLVYTGCAEVSIVRPSGERVAYLGPDSEAALAALFADRPAPGTPALDAARGSTQPEEPETPAPPSKAGETLDTPGTPGAHGSTP